MESRAISRIVPLVIGIFVALIATIQIFSAGGSALANSFRVLTPLAIVIGFASPRLGFYLLLLAGAYLDLIKRFLVLESAFTDQDLAFMLGFAPALVAGMTLLFVIQMVYGREVSGREVKLFFIITGLCIVLGGATVLAEKGLRGAGMGLNMVAYFYLPLLIPRIFTNLRELRKVMISTVIIYLPAALWAVHQAYFGIAGFEMAYLLSGMTNEIRQLDEEIFRNMGTMVSAHALSMVSSIMISALILPISWKDGRFTIRVWLQPMRWVCLLIFAWGGYCTFSRTGWVCGLIAIAAFVVLQSRTLTLTGFFAGIAGLATLYCSAKYILAERYIQIWQDELFTRFATTAEMRQALVIGTLEARLDSMSSFVNESSLWSPFGLKAAGREVEVAWVHDILSEMLVKVGYVPLAILVVGGLVCLFQALKAMQSLPKGPYRNFATYYSALTIGVVAAGFSQGAMIFYFPVNMFWCLFFAMAFASYHKGKGELPAAVQVPPQSPSPALRRVPALRGRALRSS